MEKKFNCIQCGECCRHIGHIPELEDYHDGDGICMYLNQSSSLCMIYNSRPFICDVSKAYDIIFSNNMEEDEYLEKNYKGCKNLWQMKKTKP